MSAANEEITLTELERLIKLLGLLASTHDGEALNAARLAVKWVADKQTSWEALLTPEPLPLPVAGVAAPRDPDVLAQAAEADRAEAFRNGYAAGLRDASAQWAAQLKAQAQMASNNSAWNANQQTMAAGPAQKPVHAAQSFAGPGQGGTAQTPSGAPGGPAHVASGGGRVWPAGSWQAVCVELLERHAAVPGVLRQREEVFVQDILTRGFPSLTQAQEDWLRAIAARSGMIW